MATLDSLKQNVGTATKKKTGGTTINDLLIQMQPAMEQALPKHMNVERMMRLVTTAIKTTPQLRDADAGSLLGAVMQSAQLGLEPGLLGQCYLLPFKNKNKGITEVQFIIGYKGMIDLARRSGHIKMIYAHAVYENDLFEYELGLNANLKHVPTDEERGAFKGAYAVAHFKDGGYQFEYMSKNDIDKRRGRSKSANSNYSPWNTDYEEMAKKTVIRHIFKYLPVSIEVQDQLQSTDEGIAKDVTKMKDITPDTPLIDFAEDNEVEIPQENEATQNDENDEVIDIPTE